MYLYAIDRNAVKTIDSLLGQHIECERMFRYLIDVYNDLIEEGLLLDQKKLEYSWFEHPFLVKSEGYFDLCDFVGAQHLFMDRYSMEKHLWQQMAAEHRVILEKFAQLKSKKTDLGKEINTPLEYVKFLYEKYGSKSPSERLNWIDNVFKDVLYEIERNDFVAFEDLADKFIIKTSLVQPRIFVFNQLIRYLSPFELCRIESFSAREQALVVENSTKVPLRVDT